MNWAQPAIDLLTKGHRATIQVSAAIRGVTWK